MLPIPFKDHHIHNGKKRKFKGLNSTDAYAYKTALK